MGRTTRKDIFDHSQKLEQCRREIGTSFELQKGPRRLDHQLDQQRDPTSTPYPGICPNPSLSLTITLLLVGHCYYLLKRMGRDLTCTYLMTYLKYSLDIKEGFSNFISIKSYRENYQKGHLPPVTEA